MHKLTISTLLVALAASTFAAGMKKAPEPPVLQLTADREWQIYPVNSNANVKVSVIRNGYYSTNGVVAVKITNDGGKEVFVERKYDLKDGNPFNITFKVTKPCFALVKAKLEKSSWEKRVRIGFDIEKLRPAAPEPKDFDAWWAAQFAEQDKLTDTISIRPMPEQGFDKRWDYYCVRAKTFVPDGCTYGVLSVPKRAKGKKLGCFVITQCVGEGYTTPDPNYAREDMMTLALSVHPWDPIAPDYMKVYAAENKKCVNGTYTLRGFESRETYHYRNAILGCRELIKYVRSREDFNGTLLYVGGSQGGGFGLILGGVFVDAFTAVAVQMPAMCDFGGFAIGRRSGWPFPGDNFMKTHPDADLKSVLERFGYFDGVNWAKRIKSPILFTIGAMDDCCAVSGTIAAYNVVPKDTPKFLQYGTDWTHSTGWGPAHFAYGFLQNFIGNDELRTPYRYWWTWK